MQREHNTFNRRVLTTLGVEQHVKNVWGKRCGLIFLVIFSQQADQVVEEGGAVLSIEGRSHHAG